MSKKDKVEVSFRIKVDGMIGGSFEMPRADYERLRAKWEARGNHHEETDLADELLGLAPFDYFRYLNVEDMEIEEMEIKP